MEGEPYKPKAEFNAAITYLQRVNSIFTLLDKANIQNNPFLRFSALDALSIELSMYFTPDEDHEIDEHLIAIDRELQLIKTQFKDDGSICLKTSLWLKMRIAEKTLRAIYHREGLQMKEKSNDELDDF